ncbi:MAG: hypothetical protein NZM04_10165, partial [Methylacidiphilales bacterium]|nr:hypothetical protein [Candidatus Methylacidiphilales bacterium]
KPIQSAASGSKEGSPLLAKYYRNRIYSTVHGRFLQPDPIGFEARDVNRYGYVGNGVVNYIDHIDSYDLCRWRISEILIGALQNVSLITSKEKYGPVVMMILNIRQN